MARKQYKEAAKTAIIIANEEQVNGTFISITKIRYITVMDLFLFQETTETLTMSYSACTKN